MIALELGGKEATAFASFGLEPLAAASIGQAHAATLSDGTEVVVKVRRPGTVEQVGEDLEILRNLAAFASRRWEAAARYDLVGLADEFAETLRAELDYLAEGHNADRFATNFAGDSDVHIPKVFWETTTSRVITLERIYGMKVTDLAALEQAGVDRQQLAQRAARLMAKMVFEDGFFHADPHPGTSSSSRAARSGSSTSGWSASSTRACATSSVGSCSRWAGRMPTGSPMHCWQLGRPPAKWTGCGCVRT